MPYPFSLNDEQLEEFKKVMYSQTVKATAAQFGISHSTAVSIRIKILKGQK